MKQSINDRSLLTEWFTKMLKSCCTNETIN